MPKKLLILGFAILTLAACNRIKDTAKNTINKTGEVVGEGATQLADGLKNGATNTFHCDLKIAQSLNNTGISAGKFDIHSGDSTSSENTVSVYLIFEKDFDKQIVAKVTDKNNLEYGRASLEIKAKKGDAKFFDFKFDKRTNIETKSTITIE